MFIFWLNAFVDVIYVEHFRSLVCNSNTLWLFNPVEKYLTSKKAASQANNIELDLLRRNIWEGFVTADNSK